jgi:CRISPR-associated protein Cas2
VFIVVSYDVVSDRQRTRVLKLLKGYGTHVQYSVFECDLDALQIARLKRELADLIDTRTDSVRLYLLDPPAVRRTQVLGQGRITIDPAYYYVRD